MSIEKNKLQEAFEKQYADLNENQKQAVDAIEGPVMVIAGPGTGKTQILAIRIGKILLETDTNPACILCLTYTDAGAIAMRKRLIKLIGPDAHRVNIYTFHAFCNDIIQDNLTYFDKTALDPISDLETIDYLKEVINNFDTKNPLFRYKGNVYYDISNLRNLFSDMKKEDWDAEIIAKKIEEYLIDIENREEFRYQRKFKEFNKGDLKLNLINDEKEKMEKLKSASESFEAMQNIMQENNRYDYDDMLQWVKKAFENNENFLLRYQEQYHYILVDEYQDTNEVQNKIVDLLIGYWDQANIFVVGDPNQSIFRFQGANARNMETFRKNYKNYLQEIELTINYRSVQNILDVAQSLIINNKNNATNNSNPLVCSSEKLVGKNIVPIINEYISTEEEMIHITQQIDELINKKNVLPKNIAVLYKENIYGDELIKFFKQKNIPYYNKRSINILDTPLIKKIILILQYVDAELQKSFSGDTYLFEILHFDWFQIPPIEIAKLTTEINFRSTDATATLRSLLFAKTHKHQQMDLFNQELENSNFKKASDCLENLISTAPNVTVQTLLESVLHQTGLLKKLLHSETKSWDLQVLTGFFNFVKEETRRYPEKNLHDLVDMLAVMNKEKISLPLADVTGMEQGVNLLTTHGSKGLEFEYVFIVGMNAGKWEKKRSMYSGFKNELSRIMFTDAATKNDEEELRRLFYVAITRAEKYLYISYCLFNDKGKEAEASMFIEEIKQTNKLIENKVVLSQNDLDEWRLLLLSEDEQPTIASLEKEFANKLLSNFEMSASALNSYLQCPLNFYFNTLIRIPAPKNEYMEFGSAVHYALEKLFKKMQEDDKKVFPEAKILVQDFEWYMQRHKENFTDEQFKRRLVAGKEILEAYYEKNISTFKTIVSIELFIRNVVIEGVPIKGKTDKLEFDKNYVNVVDYKTGKFENARPKLLPPNDKDPNGGDYWRQAVFYKLLVDNFPQKQWNVISTEFDFVEPDSKGVFHKAKLNITEADLTTVREQIKTVWEKIQQHDFYTGCGKPDCMWCEFAKEYKLSQ